MIYGHKDIVHLSGVDAIIVFRRFLWRRFHSAEGEKEKSSGEQDEWQIDAEHRCQVSLYHGTGPERAQNQA